MRSSPPWLVVRVRRAWLPLVGARYADEFARDQLRALIASTLIYLTAVVFDLVAIMVAFGLREVVLVQSVVALTLPATVSFALLWRKGHSKSAARLSEDLWGADIPVLGAMPISRVSWASSWMDANGLSPRQIEELGASLQTGERVVEPAVRAPDILKWSSMITLVGVLATASGALFVIQIHARALDKLNSASLSNVLLLTLLTFLGSTVLTVLLWLARATSNGIAVARLSASCVLGLITCAAVIGQVSLRQAWFVADVGLALCALGATLSWTPASSVFVHQVGATAIDRAKQVRSRVQGNLGGMSG